MYSLKGGTNGKVVIYDRNSCLQPFFFLMFEVYQRAFQDVNK